MSSTYSTTLRIQLIDTNTEFEAWGQPTDNNLGTIIEQAITGIEAVSLTNLTTYTLTTANASPDQARNAVLLFTGNLNANCNVIAPSLEKVYVISNQTTNNKAITIKTSGGNGIQLSNGTNQLVYCNGTTFFSAVNVNNILGDLSISGNFYIAGTKITLSNSVISQNTSNLTFNAPTSNVISFQPTTGAFTVPYGTIAQRPATPAFGMSRWNTDLGWYEIWNGTIWQQITGSLVANYLAVAGGGSGNVNAGGGAGGLLQGTVTLAPVTVYSIVIGAGGVNFGSSPNGSNTTVFGLTAVGGGEGGTSGGSGGGAYLGGIPSGVLGQGNNGGNSLYQGGNTASGGGGGAGAAGTDATSGQSGSGGIGIASSISGSSVYYAGGGGGGAWIANGGIVYAAPAAGGLGGGGAGTSSASGTNGTANTGGGGGAAAQINYGSNPGGNGGSGIVIISYPGAQRGTGGTITTYSLGGNTYYVHTFTASGTFTTN